MQRKRKEKNRKGPSCAPRSALFPIISVLSRLRAARPEAALVSQGTVARCLAAEFGRSGAAGSSRCRLLSILHPSSHPSPLQPCSRAPVSACESAHGCECYESNGCVKHVDFSLFPRSTSSKRDLCVHEVSLCALSISSTHHMSLCMSARDSLIQDKPI